MIQRSALVMLLTLAAASVGCRSEYGVALVNRTGGPLDDVSIVSDWNQGERYSLGTSELPQQGTLQIYPTTDAIPRNLTARWRVGSEAQQERPVEAQIPNSFDGYFCVEFDPDGVHPVLIERSKFADYLRSGAAAPATSPGR